MVGLNFVGEGDLISPIWTYTNPKRTWAARNLTQGTIDNLRVFLVYRSFFCKFRLGAIFDTSCTKRFQKQGVLNV